MKYWFVAFDIKKVASTSRARVKAVLDGQGFKQGSESVYYVPDEPDGLTKVEALVVVLRDELDSITDLDIIYGVRRSLDDLTQIKTKHLVDVTEGPRRILNEMVEESERATDTMTNFVKAYRIDEKDADDSDTE